MYDDGCYGEKVMGLLDNLDKIIMKDLQFYGYHGVMEEEKALGQPFTVNIEMFASLKNAGVTDSIEETVHYGHVYEDIKAIVENKRYQLLEALAEAMAERILDVYPRVNEVKVEIQKPKAPINGIFAYMAVQIHRKRLL